ncbi:MULTISPECIES: pyridoxal phosphate-dependent aminotransferase [unclassified Coprococcus]|jgi:aspartate aminotransferase|uniref:pyridoxal phosphate-dependent aminotransferase n=1 Tax=unclassified Coprococcus TaxID=2684943 RepID=UPI000E510C08|nr:MULTISPECIES: pyridoxal phosphate-dependent aminotransferase [unclassified Coprococcus]MZK37606.1 pyridoxal phosphate-dependent aminotransferase [Coprococcus sp. BIOML-A1]MZK62682.1 pyridoxal phosphate-dependent aminotransferase [Coprococcus sp. BIOML-A2]RGI37580.1 pyridoxal phosphate-dependent aminotransferase [Coprococcus sp. OM06-34AC]RGI43949.1 pyridoxal phosphate-dependent aminotransferase [Coprococcus sp. OM06-25]RHU52291.1 pyridoxal phosphate-dependent aminotransferase [Coprococcus s
MISKKYSSMLNNTSIIREFAQYASKRAAEIGAENVFNYTIGNPSVPTTDDFNKGLIDLIQNEDSLALHGYSPTLTIYSVRKAVADSLNRRFGMEYVPEDIFMTSGAAGALAHAIRCVTEPGDEVITFAPYFPEYVPYVDGTGAVLKVVPADITSFQINFDAFLEMMNPNVQAILINSPNNPSGIVYSTETITHLAQILSEKQEEYGHDIYLISDEPYREIVFEGTDSPFISKFYDNTICCYSFSKSLSLPGERIGYVAVNPKCKDAELIINMCGQVSRFTGHNCPSSLIQLGVAKVLDETSDLSIYEKNKNILYKELTAMGYECVEPGGTFYMFPKTPIADANEFCNMTAHELDLILVPGDSFMCPGHMRLAYCTTTDMVERSLPLFEKAIKMCK